MIYHHIFPKMTMPSGILPARMLNGPLANKTNFKSTIQMTMRKKSDRPHHHDPRFPSGHGLAALMVNRQIRDEVLPVFYSNYNFTFYQDRANIPKAVTWLKSLQAEQLCHVQRVTVQMREIDCFDLVSWMRFEDEHLSRCAGNMQVTLDFRHKSDMKWYGFAYQKCLELRNAGKSWQRIENRSLDRIQDKWERRIDAGLESESGSDEDREDDHDSLDDDEYDTDIDAGYDSDESMPWQETM